MDHYPYIKRYEWGKRYIDDDYSDERVIPPEVWITIGVIILTILLILIILTIRVRRQAREDYQPLKPLVDDPIRRSNEDEE